MKKISKIILNIKIKIKQNGILNLIKFYSKQTPLYSYIPLKRSLVFLLIIKNIFQKNSKFQK